MDRWVKRNFCFRPQIKKIAADTGKYLRLSEEICGFVFFESIESGESVDASDLVFPNGNPKRPTNSLAAEGTPLHAPSLRRRRDTPPYRFMGRHTWHSVAILRRAKRVKRLPRIG